MKRSQYTNSFNNIRKFLTCSKDNNNNKKETSFIAREIVDTDMLLAEEMGLIVTITSELPDEIKRFKDAMIAEVEAIENLGVFEEKDVPKGTHVIGVKWVLKEKKATSLSPAKLKARLVAKGYNQQEKINFGETFDLLLDLKP